MIIRSCLLAVVLVLGPDATFGQNPEDSTTPSPFLLAPGHAGPFQVGMSVWELYRIVDESDTVIVDLPGEGGFTPAIQVQMEGSEVSVSIVAHLSMLECPRFRKWFLPIIEVRDPRFRTEDDMGVGSTLAELREHGWLTADGRFGAKALGHRVIPNFPRVRFIFEGREGECEGCERPPDDARVVAVSLLEPAQIVRATQCESYP